MSEACAKCAYVVSLEFCVGLGRSEISSDRWPLFARPGETFEGYETRCGHLQPIVTEIQAHLRTIDHHLRSLGLVPGRSLAADDAPAYYLITEVEEDRESLLLGRFEAKLQTIADTFDLVLSAYPVEVDEALRAIHHSPKSHWFPTSPDGSAAPERAPREELIERAFVPLATLEAAEDSLDRLGGRLDLYAKLFAGLVDEPVEWLVERVTPFGAVTTLVGIGAAGKSTGAQELLAAVTARSGPKEFWGQPVHGCHAGALACGEDTAGIVSTRRLAHQKIWPDHDFMAFYSEGADSLLAILRSLESVPGRGLLVVDTLGAFASGDHTKDHVANDFYQPLTSFARRKEWAVVVLHHLVKNPPQSLSQILPSVKGSTSHVDRPRMVLAMLNRQGGTVEVGCIKTNFPEGAWRPVNEGVFLRRDADTLRLLPMDGSIPAQREADEGAKQRVLAAVRNCNGREVPVRRTGGLGLFKQGLGELAGMTRQQIEAAAGALLESGQIINTENGLVAVDKS